jgi:hypothetical protein
MKSFENFLCGIMPTDFAYSSSFPRYKGVKMETGGPGENH